jgi:hypothetical protein
LIIISDIGDIGSVGNLDSEDNNHTKSKQLCEVFYKQYVEFIKPSDYYQLTRVPKTQVVQLLYNYFHLAIAHTAKSFSRTNSIKPKETDFSN